MLHRKNLITPLIGLVLAASAGVAAAQEQFVPLLSYRVGAYASGGSGIFGGYIDYMSYINMKEGGVNGVKLAWEECETEYNNSRGVECYERLKKKGGGAALVQPLSTGITYSLIDRVVVDKVPMVTLGYGRTDAADGRVFPWVFPMITTYWSQADAMVKFIAKKEGGDAKMKGKKLVHLYHDSAYGKEPIGVFQAYAKKLGYEFTAIAVPHPGNEQSSQWQQIRQIKPDYVDPLGLGRDEPDRHQDGAAHRFPAREADRRLVGRRRGGRDSGGRGVEGVHDGRVQRLR